jgi:hypothetical protein
MDMRIIKRGASRALMAIAACLAAAASSLPAQDAAADSRALRKVDSYRAFDQAGFSFDFASTGSEGSSLMRVSVRLGGEEAALVRYLEPARLRGRLVLVRGDSFWLLDKGMKKPIRISPRQLLFGQASAGDVSRISFGAMYEAAGRSESGGRQLFRLSAKKGSGATYDFVDLTTDADCRPIEAACKGRSGTVIKVISYEKYEIIGGKEMLTGFAIADEVSGETERIRLSNFDSTTPPDSAFSIQGMRFRE